jgi:hypothetical protein
MFDPAFFNIFELLPLTMLILAMLQLLYLNPNRKVMLSRHMYGPFVVSCIVASSIFAGPFLAQYASAQTGTAAYQCRGDNSQEDQDHNCLPNPLGTRSIYTFFQDIIQMAPST